MNELMQILALLISATFSSVCVWCVLKRKFGIWRKSTKQRQSGVSCWNCVHTHARTQTFQAKTYRVAHNS